MLPHHRDTLVQIWPSSFTSGVVDYIEWLHNIFTKYICLKNRQGVLFPVFPVIPVQCLVPYGFAGYVAAYTNYLSFENGHVFPFY